ncbi:hypothetical protein [Streptomyces sp. T028]|uniref:hypothetical protein n=1 Tax=Streptomyces sp. T028 TaxID=3394379 RepID=UPI003A884F28
MTVDVFRSRRLVLPGPSELPAVADFASRRGFKLIRDATSDPRFGVTRELAWELDPGLELYYVEETKMASCFLQVEGDDKEDVNETADLLAELFRAASPERLLDDVDSAATAEQYASAILRLGLGAPAAFDEEVYRRIAAAIDADGADIRRAGIWSTAFSRWPEFGELLERVAATDEVPELRREAAIVGQFEGGRS